MDGALLPWRTERRKLYKRRARAARMKGDAKRAHWYDVRAKSLRRTWTERAEDCGKTRELVLTCAACGTVEVRPLACSLRHWCPACALERSRREYGRIRRALDARAREERARWYREGKTRHRAPQLRILTLTVRDAAELEETRDAIAKAWPKLRRWLHDACGYAPPFAAVWEVTEGTTGGGHPHLHVCAVLPWIDVRELAEAWVRATHGRAEAQGLDLTTVTPTGAAKYVAAYVTASALDGDLPVKIAAAWTRASYGRRLIHASAKFWVPLPDAPRCDCGCMERRHVTTHSLITYGTNKGGSRAPPPLQTPNPAQLNLHSSRNVLH